MDRSFSRIRGGVTAPSGFLASGVRCGIKSASKDLGIIFSERRATASGLFTQNRVKAAPILLSKRQLRDKAAQAIVVNSGNANACTGKRGFEDAKKMAYLASECLHIKANDVLVASTGVIGSFLPMESVEYGIRDAAKRLTRSGGGDFSEAIMTTDTARKSAAVEFVILGKKVKLGGAAKGAGMIHPGLATMLCFFTTDLSIDPDLLSFSLKKVVQDSFNLISIDGCMSTNDAVFILANGLAGNKEIETTGLEHDIFMDALRFLARHLAGLIVEDGEGATKVLRVIIKRGGDRANCERAAKAVITSPLVKSAFYGQDPAWGRIVQAVGSSGARIGKKGVGVSIQGIKVCEGSVFTKFDLRNLRQKLKRRKVKIEVDLGLSNGEIEVFGCDLSLDYVKINSHYTT